MNASTLLARLDAAGVRVEAHGDRLHVEAPAGSVTAEVRQAMAEHKGALLAIASVRCRLLTIAASLGISREIVDHLPPDELEAAAAQAAACEGHLDGNGDPLAHSLLVFWLRGLADHAESLPIRQRALANPQHGSPET